MTTRKVHDPFLGKEVEISDKLTDRLRGKYATGPMMANGEPEFGWRQMPQIPIQLKAADRIDELESILKEVLEHWEPTREEFRSDGKGTLLWAQARFVWERVHKILGST